ncbi:MAG: RNA polymerase sigma factor [Saprospiraceae bacterium]|nr:RNA polymerase sigma factor [Saprospiraceae bacterium]
MTEVQFKHYYQNNISALQNFARRLTNNRFDQEDLVQETLAKAFKSMHTFKKGNSFKSWAFTILKNTFITKYHKKRKRAELNTPVEEMTYAMDNYKTINNNALSKMRIKEIKKCFHHLSTKSKHPFLMHVDGYQYNEIADSLDIPIGTVKSRINFARTKLKSMLREKGLIQAA